MRFAAASRSDAGGRIRNEDSCLYAQTERFGCWAIGDGVGGRSGGTIASLTAVTGVVEAANRRRALSEAAMIGYVQSAQEAIYARQKQQILLAGMRTTIVMLATDFRTASWAHVGDSRLYHFRKGKIVSDTKDHSYCQGLVERREILREQIPTHRERNKLTRVLGSEREVRPDVRANVAVGPDDAFLLCSDGLWVYVSEAEMEADLAKSKTPEQWIDRMERRLLERAKAGHDNYSAIAIFVKP